MRTKNNFAIIGSGISGLTCANILKNDDYKVTVFEQKEIYGGLISCTLESGNLFHRVGGHVFNSKNKIVSNWFWEKFDKEKEFVKANRNAVIHINKKFVNYPIELNLSQLDLSIAKKIIFELIDLSNQSEDIRSRSFEEFLNKNFGKTLYEIYFGKYNKKIWNKDLGTIPMDWLEGKLPMINPKEILFKNIFSSKEDNMVHSTFYYPKKGGSQFIVNRLSQGIKLKKELIKNIRIDNNKIKLNQDSNPFDSVIFTGDVRDLKNILDKKIIQELSLDKILSDISELDSNPTSTMLCECDANPYSWVYLPNPNIKPHRIIMTGNFSENNNSKNLNKNRISCTVECSGEVVLEQFINELAKLPFNLKYISYNFSKSSYIIQNSKTRLLINELKKKLSIKNIFLCGRFAEWEYFNMDIAIGSAIKVCNIAIT